MDAWVTVKGIQMACQYARTIPENTNPVYLDYSMTHSGITYEMRDHAPAIFHHLRTWHGIDAENYSKSWEVEKVSPSLGAGRSGSLFQRSKDHKYLFKTIPCEEFTIAVDLIVDYLRHVQDNPDCLLAPILGLLEFHHGGSHSEWYIVVLRNVVDSSDLPQEQYQPLLIYDLKGRIPKPGHFLKRKGATDIVLKDKDLEPERKFKLPLHLLGHFHQQLRKDVHFLYAHNLMDYSLLLGVATRKEGTSVTQIRPRMGCSVFQQHAGGIGSDSTNHEVYFIGIIDYLAQYGKRKRIANLLKSTRWEQQQLSTIPPDQYGERFITYFLKIFHPSVEDDDKPIPPYEPPPRSPPPTSPVPPISPFLDDSISPKSAPPSFSPTQMPTSPTIPSSPGAPCFAPVTNRTSRAFSKVPVPKAYAVILPSISVCNVSKQPSQELLANTTSTESSFRIRRRSLPCTADEKELEERHSNANNISVPTIVSPSADKTS